MKQKLIIFIILLSLKSLTITAQQDTTTRKSAFFVNTGFSLKGIKSGLEFDYQDKFLYKPIFLNCHTFHQKVL